MELPPATHATGHYTRSPERSPAEDLSRLTGDGLIDYLEQLGVAPASIQIILNTCQDGLEWTNLIREVTAGGTTATQEFLRDELKIQSRLTRSKLTADVRCAVNLEERTQEDRAHQRGLESHRAARQNYSPTVELNTSNREADEESPGGRDHHGSRVRVQLRTNTSIVRSEH